MSDHADGAARAWRASAERSLVVGVTGHRSERLQSALRLAPGLTGPLPGTLLLGRVAEVLAALARAGAPARPCLVSSLAEGADRLVAEVALALDYRLFCPLPFPRHDYERDFDAESLEEFRALLAQAESVVELAPPASGERVDGYLGAGRTLLRASDVLLALWDGAPPRGVGGTGQIVAEAIAGHLPVIWIAIEPPHPIALRGTGEPNWREPGVDQVPATEWVDLVATWRTRRRLARSGDAER